MLNTTGVLQTWLEARDGIVDHKAQFREHCVAGVEWRSLPQLGGPAIMPGVRLIQCRHQYSRVSDVFHSIAGHRSRAKRRTVALSAGP